MSIPYEDRDVIYKFALPDSGKNSLWLPPGSVPLLVSDYTCHDALDAVTDAHGEHWEGKAQPTKPCPYQAERDAFNARARAFAAVSAAARFAA